MKIILAGGTGFLGTSLTRLLVARGDEVVVLTRGNEKTVSPKVRWVHWNAKTSGPWAKELEGADAIINFVGRTVDCRKTEFHKKEILESRVHSIQALAAAWNEVKNPPKIWVQSATAHLFGDTNEEILDDTSPIGSGFAPMVGTAWEKALSDAHLPNVRKVFLRISFVLGNDGGAMDKLGLVVRCFLGGTLGSGKQYISWLHIDDLNAMVLRALDNEKMNGAYVATAPEPVTNRVFMQELRRAFNRPWAPPTPEFLLRIGSWFLRTDPELALLGRRVIPSRLLKEGFVFKHPTLREALSDLLLRSEGL